MNVGRERLKNETFPPLLYLLCCRLVMEIREDLVSG